MVETRSTYHLTQVHIEQPVKAWNPGHGHVEPSFNALSCRQLKPSWLFEYGNTDRLSDGEPKA